MSLNFTHLHVHSEYSQLDGHGNPEAYAKRAKALGMSAIAITDHANIDGAIQWQKACARHGIDPIIGCELYVVPDAKVKAKGDKRGHMTVLVEDVHGYHCLLRLLSKAYVDGYYYRPRIGFDDILGESDYDLHGLCFLTGCCESFINLPGGEEFLWALGALEHDLVFEVMPTNIPHQKEHNKNVLRLAQEMKAPVVATADCHYVLKQHAQTQEVMLAIQRKAKWNDANRWTFTSSHLRSFREMCVAFDEQGVLTRRQYLSALAYTNEVARWCSGFRIPKLDIELPKTRYEKQWEHLNADEILEELCDEGKRRLFPDTGVMPSRYQERYNLEMELIQRKGFSRYFLIVKEIVDWCKGEGIMVGPGRGSVGGSLLALLLGITQGVDPIRYGLLFERFISEDRLDYPDIDLDFENIKCDQVRQHLEEEYGTTHVAGISTFLRLKSKASVRDVGRVFDLPPKEVDTFAKAINPKEHDEDIIASAGNELPEGQKFKAQYPKEFDLMVTLEGTIRTAGQHPAGLIVSGTDLMCSDRCHLLKRKDKFVINWDMGDSEYAGLMKIDILKLDTLTVLQEARRLLKRQGVEIDYGEIPLDDPTVYRRLAQGDLEGVFQLSGYACAKLCEKIQIDDIEDVAAIISLARPGPAESGMTDLYVARKKGAKWNPVHPSYEAITEETYGVMAYQEQMMRAMVDLAGFSGNDADRIRKVIGKKRKASEFEPYRLSFLEGCAKKGTFNEAQATEFWNGLLEWAHYGFNKSHAIEYAIIAYWTAYVKYKHPVEFICAQLTYGSNKEKMVKQAAQAGLQVVTPKVGTSEPVNWVAKDGMLYMPFIEINGVGETDAAKCPGKSKPLPKKHGFFDLEEIGLEENNYKDSLTKLLDQVKAFDPDPSVVPDECLAYFQYEITPAECQVQDEIAVVKRQAIIDQEALQCTACKLRKEASQVVLSSKGLYNAMVLAEAPGKDEDSKGVGLIGKAGQLFWKELARYNINRRMVHYGNVCKCWPSKTKTPHRGHINTCFNKWMVDEIKSMNCKLVLGMGNSVLFAIHGQSGITDRSGTIEYIPKLGAWVVWCVHPSAVLRNQPFYEPVFQKGVEMFATKFIQLTEHR